MYAVSRITSGMLLCLFLQTPSNSDEPVQRDNSEKPSGEERLQGIWNLVTLSEKHEGYMLLSGNRMYSLVGKKVHTGSFTVDASKSPPHIDIKGHDGDRKIHLRGIYKLQKNGWLFIVLSEGNSPRPTGFKSDKHKEGVSHMMVVRGKQAIKAGSYTGEVNRKTWTLVLDERNRFTIKNEKQVLHSGVYVSKDTELIFLSEEKDVDTGKVHDQVGRYKLAVNENMISFSLLEDDLNDRQQAVTATSWERVGK